MEAQLNSLCRDNLQKLKRRAERAKTLNTKCTASAVTCIDPGWQVARARILNTWAKMMHSDMKRIAKQSAHTHANTKKTPTKISLCGGQSANQS
jgi:hypothetical protein